MPAIRVAGVVPLPSSLGGQGELLMITAFGGARLPSGDLLPNESIHEGTARVVQRVTGARVEPRRVAFLLERVFHPSIRLWLWPGHAYAAWYGMNFNSGDAVDDRQLW